MLQADCRLDTHVQHVLHQLMALFGEVAPVSSNEVLAIGVQQLGVTARGEISWDQKSLVALRVYSTSHSPNAVRSAIP